MDNNMDNNMNKNVDKNMNNTMNKMNANKNKLSEIRFTKVLTKYSTEYNNSLFIQDLCQKLSLDKKDTFSFFLDLRLKYSDEDIYSMFETYDINKLDINRIYRYLDKYTNKDCKVGGDDVECDTDVTGTELYNNDGLAED